MVLDWILVACYMEKWRFLFNCWFSETVWNYLTSKTTISFSRRSRLLGVIKPLLCGSRYLTDEADTTEGKL
jgi:hypothetical protein